MITQVSEVSQLVTTLNSQYQNMVTVTTGTDCQNTSASHTLAIHHAEHFVLSQRESMKYTLYITM